MEHSYKSCMNTFKKVKKQNISEIDWGLPHLDPQKISMMLYNISSYPINGRICLSINISNNYNSTSRQDSCNIIEDRVHRLPPQTPLDLGNNYSGVAFDNKVVGSQDPPCISNSCPCTSRFRHRNHRLKEIATPVTINPNLEP